MKCKDCKYCKQIGRQQSQRGRLGRKTYYCEYPGIYELRDEFGYQINNFIGYGDMTVESPLTLKTSKKWCQWKEKKE